jgi:hypothetical protein
MEIFIKPYSCLNAFATGKFYVGQILIADEDPVTTVIGLQFETRPVQIRTSNNMVKVWADLFRKSTFESATSSAILNTVFYLQN